MKTIEEKIKNKAYAKAWIASAVVKRADISARERNKLLALVDTIYNAAEKDTNEALNPGLDPFIVQPPKFMQDRPSLDEELGRVAIRLLHLCVDHKLSREEIYKRLEARLMAGMG